MKKEYEKPEVEIINIREEDIITDSPPGTDWDDF